MRYKKIKLGDISKVSSSKRIFAKQYVDFGIPFYRQKEIIDKKNKAEISDPLFISQETYDEIKKRFGVPQKGDLLITAVGVTLGIPYVVDDEIFYFKDGNLIWLREFDNEIDSNYIYYWILSDVGQKSMWARTIGSAQPALTIDTIKQFEIPVPSYNAQVKIVSILKAYDDLIENNQKQIKLLEEAAQRLYKEWFVDLRFPGYEDVAVVDGVPEGWQERTLSEIADVVMGQSPKSEFYNRNQDGLPFHQGVGSYGTRFVVDETYSTSLTRIAEANSVLFSVRAPVGRLNITKNKIVIGRGLAAINQKDGYQSYLFYLLKERFFKDDVVGNGSIFASISKDELLRQRFTFPAKDLIVRFNNLVAQLDKKIAALDSQTELLKQARDRLLPRLMNGELEV